MNMWYFTTHYQMTAYYRGIQRNLGNKRIVAFISGQQGNKRITIKTILGNRDHKKTFVGEHQFISGGKTTGNPERASS